MLNSPMSLESKVGFAFTYKKGLIIWARIFPSNPYDARTLVEQLEQAKTLTEEHNPPFEQVYVDLGYLGVDYINPGVEIIYLGK